MRRQEAINRIPFLFGVILILGIALRGSKVQAAGAEDGPEPVTSKDAAEEVPPVLISGDEENGFRYMIQGIGGFTASCENGGSDAFVYIEPEDGVAILHVLRDGAEVTDTSGIYMELGSYEVTIGTAEAHAVFRFRVTDTGEQLISSLSENSLNVTIVREPDTEFSYDAEREVCRYTLADGEWIECNVPQGGYTRGTVRIETSMGLGSFSTLRDGEYYLQEGNEYRETGDYIVTLWDLNDATNGGNAYRLDYCFHIYGTPELNVSMIPAPQGMRLISIERNGRPQEILSDRAAFLKEDGSYRIGFAARNDERIVYTTELVRDTAAPAVSFSPEFADGDTIRKDIYFTRMPDVATLTVYRDGGIVEAEGGCIRVGGRYRIEVADAAGNTRAYSFILKNGVPLPTGRLVIISAVLLLAGGGILLYARRHMRVL